MLRIHFSNDTGRLADLLLDRLTQTPDSPFEAEHLIVPGAGMRRFLELRHADRFGITANLNFSFPAAWVWQQVRGILGDASEESPYSAEVMTWRIYAWLAGDQRRAGKRLDAYLAHSDEAMRYELSMRIASLFEQMVTYRPDWLADWADGRPAQLPGANATQRDDAAWLAQAWREIMRGTGGPRQHPVHTLLDTLEAAGRDGARQRGLPSRVSLFGLAELPPLYLDFMSRLARLIDVDAYLFNPCAEYWFDIVSPQRRARLDATGKAHSMEIGNSLLAHWGQQTKALAESMVSLSDDDTVLDFVEPGSDTMLHQVQHAILHLAEIVPGTLRLDDSIVVHACHSLMRQIEVLHDQLLARFAADPTLHPGDVLVVLPDLDDAAAAIDAVFNAVPEDDSRRIPYRISGLGAHQAAPLTRALFGLIDMHGSRFEASIVFGLLQQPIIARRFGLDGTALDTVHRWMRDTGMHWGRDAAHRAQLGLPASARHTLGDGFKQLLLGYALPLPGHDDFADCLPYADIEGEQAWWLGGFWKFYDQLNTLTDALNAPHTPNAWAALFNQILEDFFAPGPDDVDELLRLRTAIADVPRLAGEAGTGALAIPVAIASRALEQRVIERTPGATASGAVTFTAMTPLRQLPFRLICVLGLDHAAFPGENRTDEFDLMAAFARKGDRQRRRDDRNVFLDLMLCARDALYLSYTGRDIHDNGVVPPSVVVAELLDFLDRASGPGNDLRARVETVHPAQPHSPRYFDGAHARLFSFNRANHDAAAAPTQPRRPGFFNAMLPAADDAFRSITLSDLTRFFQHPVNYLLKQRLRIALDDVDELLADDEPFAIEGSQRWEFRDLVLDLVSEGRDDAQVLRAARLANQLPDGISGEIELEPMLDRARSFQRRLADARIDQAREPLALRLHAGPYTLEGELHALRDEGLLLWDFKSESVRTLLHAWIRHLALCIVRPARSALCTQWIGEASAFHLLAVDDAEDRLRDLLELYWEGLHRPLHFFPQSALALARSGKIGDAGRKWRSEFAAAPSESEHPAYRLVFGDSLPTLLDTEFERLATRVFAPLLMAYREGLRETA